jgi:hypothetical protein
MFKRKLILLQFISLMVVFGLFQFSSADVPSIREMSKMDCKTCHSCDNPTMKDKCLKACPSLPLSHAANDHKLSEAPDSMLLDDLVDLYQPVHFNHKLHARMAEMGGECSTCHHYSPTDKIQPCKDCHGGQANPNNLRQPGLKGAYHRQCLSCHREWSHDTKCVLCHIPTEGKAMASGASDTTDIMGAAHPIITEPSNKVYHTPLTSGPIVTFKHKEHIVLFGLRCVDCHKKENCSYCHDLQKPAALVKSEQQIHGMCNDCHRQDKCQKCHDNRERPAFSHESTGWALNRYHNRLDCQACHPTGKKIARLSNQCEACHGGWNQDNFEHAATGLELDETHLAMDCTDCHANRKYNAKPDCSGCHDDGRTYKDMPPGKVVKKM